MPMVRKPSEILKINGTFAAQPARERARAREPKQLSPIGLPPKSLTRDERAMWNEIVGENPAGVLTSGDRKAMELLSILFAKFRRRETLTGGELSKLMQCLSLIGMTPADRSRIITTGGKPDENPFSEFAD